MKVSFDVVDEPTIVRADTDNIAVLRLNRPAKRNALRREDIVLLHHELLEIAHDSSVRGMVLTGTDDAFCAGADLAAVAAMAEESAATITENIEGLAQQMIRALLAVPVPTIAAIDGPAIGLGMDIALACDSRLIGVGGWMMQGWGRIGLIPGTGGELLLRRLNPTILWYLLERQPRIDAAMAADWGLAEAVSDRAAVHAFARSRALAQLPTAALQGYVRLSRVDLLRDLDEHLEDCAHLQGGLIAGADFGLHQQKR